jgi:hypothetical protein
VLRQAGAVYQFRHAELQRRLATRPVRRGRHRRLEDPSHRTRPVDPSHRTRPVDPSHRTRPGPMHPGRSRYSR